MKIDLVCKMEINENVANHSLIFEGEAYFFCSESCLAEFQRYPQDYVKPLHSSGEKGLEENGDV